MGKKGEASTDPEDEKPSKFGYCKTDPATWWPPGCKSPNPKGRPKGSKNRKTLYREAFDARVDLKMGGKAVRLSKDQASYIQLANRCATGDMKAWALKVQLDREFEEPEPPKPTEQDTDFNLKMLDDYIALRQKFARGEGGDDE